MESSRSRAPYAPALRTIELPSEYENSSPRSAGTSAWSTSHGYMTPLSPSSSSTSSSRKASSPYYEQLPTKRLSQKDMPSTPSSHSSAASHARSYHQLPHNQNDYYSSSENGYYSPDYQSRRYSPQATSPLRSSYPEYPPYAPCTPYKPLPSVSGPYPTPPHEHRPLP